MKKIMNKNHGNSLDVYLIDLFWFFCANLAVIVLMLVCAIVRIMLSTICEETTVWVAILSSTVGYILPSPNQSYE